LSGERRDDIGVLYRVSPLLGSDEVNDLFAVAWSYHERRDFDPVLQRSLVYICAYRGPTLVGFVNVAWDGGVHGFVLDTTVHPDLRRQGLGRRLVLLVAEEARERGIQWLHVDFEPHLRPFYDGCGFRPTEAGLLRLDRAGDLQGRV
jgi:GNAT superfamily N-acetyltransferase